ncbi:hypothetical protein [Sphingomonas sp.]|jgi:S1-C subfamily serine protease|uniref:hypothetical protein n=1 Tax=Sphingomonas sp. TaxID=28214 RepID=UPI0035C86A6A
MRSLRQLRYALLALLAIALGGALLSVRAMHASRGRTPDVMGATFATPAADHRAGGAWIITSLRVGGPAESAGLRVGDVVETVRGDAGAVSLAEAKREMASGDSVEFDIRRGGATFHVVMASLGDRDVGKDPGD